MGSSIDFSEYSELVNEGGFDVKTPVNPEDEFFHAVYISGQQRQNHIGETEMPGKLQIRGLRSNLDEVNMVITNVKNVLVKTFRTKEGRENLECFSYQQGAPPWKSTTSNLCGKNATERAANPFCKDCRSQLIVTGLYLDEKTGKPFMVNDKPTYVFIRAKGVKYGNIANYLSDLAKRDDLEPIITPVTEESKKFEKAQVNHKRFITKVKVGKQSTNFGLKDVFELETGSKLSVDATRSILNKTKDTMDKFKEKFDWSKRGGSADYSGAAKPVDESQKFADFSDSPPVASQPTPSSNKGKQSNITFEDVDF
jgi:hypothetical protein